MSDLEKKFKAYYFTAIFSMLFAVIGFSYNAWRLEVSEDNSNIRTAAFEVLTELAELQQLIYSAHYDQDMVAGNPRKGWVKVGLIADLAGLINEQTTEKSNQLQRIWSENWDRIQHDRSATDMLISKIDSVRRVIQQTLKSLE